MFRKLDLLPSSGEGSETSTLLGLSGKTKTLITGPMTEFPQSRVRVFWNTRRCAKSKKKKSNNEFTYLGCQLGRNTNLDIQNKL
jgi:hypothetical protein